MQCSNLRRPFIAKEERYNSNSVDLKSIVFAQFETCVHDFYYIVHTTLCAQLWNSRGWAWESDFDVFHVWGELYGYTSFSDINTWTYYFTENTEIEEKYTDQIDWLINWLIDWLLDWLIAWLIDWLIDWCLTPILAIFQLYRGVNIYYVNLVT